MTKEEGVCPVVASCYSKSLSYWETGSCSLLLALKKPHVMLWTGHLAGSDGPLWGLWTDSGQEPSRNWNSPSCNCKEMNPANHLHDVGREFVPGPAPR